MRLIDYINQFDRRLVFPWMNTIAVRITGCTEREIYASPRKQLEAARAMDQYFGADFVYPLDDGAVIREAVALQRMDTPCDFCFCTEPFITSEKDLMRYRIPEPQSDARMSVNIEAFRLISESFTKPLAVSVPGPVTVACELMEISDFARATIRNPSLVNALMEFSTEAILRYCKAAAKAGVRFLCISEPTAVIFSPKTFETMISLNLRKIFTAVGANTFCALHICGNTMPLIPAMLTTGAECLSLDQVMDMPLVASMVPRDVVLMGNLDPITLLAEETVEVIQKETHALLRKMQPYPNYMVSFGCDCLPDTPFGNLLAAMEAGRTKYADLW